MQGNTFFGFSGGGGSTPPPVSNSWLLNGNTEGAEKYFGTNDNYSIPIYTNGSAIGVFLNTGDFGFGTIAPTSRVHIKGDATASNFALKVDNFASSPLLYVNNAGNIGIGIAPTLADVKLEIKVATNQRFLFLNSPYPSIGAALTLQAINDATTDVVNVVTLGLDWYHASRNNLFSNDTNTIIPTAKVHIIGNNQGSDLYALKVDNLGLNPLFYVRNDGNVGIGLSTIIPSKLSIATDTTYDGIWLTNNTGSPLAIVGKNISGGLQTGFLDIRNTNGDIKVCLSLNEFAQSDFINTGLNFGIGNFTTVTGATAKLHVKGAANAGTYALKIDNFASSPLLYVRNDGVSTFNTSSTYATNFGYDVKWQAFSNPSSSNGNYISLCTGGGSIFQSTFSRINGGVVKSEMYFIESNDTTYMAIGVIGDANKALSLRTNDTDRLFISHNGDIGISKNAMSARLHVFGVDATNSINQRLEPVTNVTEDTTGNTVVTTDATANVTSQTIAVPADKVISLESTIVYRKTGGAGVGVTGDGTTIKLNSSVKNVGGTLTLDTVQNTYTGTTNAIAGVSATYTISGTNVLVSVTGVLNDNITWNVITKVNTVA